MSSKARDTIEAQENLHLSIGSLWEIAIKINLGKLQISRPFQELSEEIALMNAQLLPISFEDTETYISLPLHHRDPFDRILIAQATNLALAIVSRDAAFDAYSVDRVWA